MNPNVPEKDSSRTEVSGTSAGRKGESVALKPGLYLVATPVGNMRDITFRALDILAGADLIVCEDTRVTGKLLGAYNFKKKMLSYNDHNADERRDRIVAMLEDGQAVALVSDAGTPLVSDPGYKLVREAVARDIYVTVLPGANAVLSALQLSALPPDRFAFLGFLPPKEGARQKILEAWKDAPGSLVIYETAPRLVDSLRDMREVLGNRPAAVTRELTKMYEEVQRGTLTELIRHYCAEGAPKGEIVIVLGPPEDAPVSTESIEAQLRKALETMSVRDASEAVARASGKPRRAIYTLALKLAGNG